MGLPLSRVLVWVELVLALGQEENPFVEIEHCFVEGEGKGFLPMNCFSPLLLRLHTLSKESKGYNSMLLAMLGIGL